MSEVKLIQARKLLEGLAVQLHQISAQRRSPREQLMRLLVAKRMISELAYEMDEAALHVMDPGPPLMLDDTDVMRESLAG